MMFVDLIASGSSAQILAFGVCAYVLTLGFLGDYRRLQVLQPLTRYGYLLLLISICATEAGAWTRAQSRMTDLLDEIGLSVHLGTIAFGSFIVVSAALRYIDCYRNLETNRCEDNV